MNKIKVGKEEFPIHFGHSAMVKMLQLAEMTKFTEIDKLMTDFPMEKAPEAVVALIKNGIKVNKSSMKAPSQNAVIDAMDEDIMIWANILEAIGNQFSTPDDITEGNSPSKTSKQ
ncbi:MAG: hypothetical protein AAFR36_21045 [Bacteroidota bacterium]